MATTEQQLDSVMQLVRNCVHAGSPDASLDELFDLWRHENPSGELYAENVAAVAASIEDFKRGERGTAAGEHSRTTPPRVRPARQMTFTVRELPKAKWDNWPCFTDATR